jgi:hypothetical protein
LQIEQEIPLEAQTYGIKLTAIQDKHPLAKINKFDFPAQIQIGGLHFFSLNSFAMLKFLHKGRNILKTGSTRNLELF